MHSPPITDEEKCAALERVLDSRAFGRSEQLRAFLRYVCEEAFAGRADQLHEYVLGVAVFGRKTGYSPAEDSTVRSRAYDLRNKLKNYYRDEAPEDPIGIVIDKGAYVPRFVRRTEAPRVSTGDATSASSTAGSNAAASASPNASDRSSASSGSAGAGDASRDLASSASASVPASSASSSALASAEAPRSSASASAPASSASSSALASAEASRSSASASAPASARAVAPRSPLLLLAGLLVVATAVAGWWHTRTPAADVDRHLSPAMQRLWGPILDGSAPVIVSFHTRLFLFAPATELVIRDYRVNETRDIPDSPYLADFRARMGADTLVETYDYSDVGAVRAAFLFGRLLGSAATLKDSRTLDWEDLWNSHVVFVGKAGDNAAIHKLLNDADLDFVDDASGTIVRNRRPQLGEAEVYRNAATHGAGKKYGLVTVLPGPQARHRMVLLTASAAELEGALAYTVTDPERVAELMERVALLSGACPSAFQVLLEVSFAANVPTNIRAVAHRVYDPRR